MDEARALFALVNDHRKKEPRNGKTPWKVSLYRRIGIQEIDELEKNTGNDDLVSGGLI